MNKLEYFHAPMGDDLLDAFKGSTTLHLIYKKIPHEILMYACAETNQQLLNLQTLSAGESHAWSKLTKTGKNTIIVKDFLTSQIKHGSRVELPPHQVDGDPSKDKEYLPGGILTLAINQWVAKVGKIGDNLKNLSRQWLHLTFCR